MPESRATHNHLIFTTKSHFCHSSRIGGRIGQPGPYRNPACRRMTRVPQSKRWIPKSRASDIWLVELAHDVASRFTFDPHNDIYAVWSPDGARIAFGSNREPYALRRDVDEPTQQREAAPLAF
jgi:WD40 repeat protein